MLALILNMLETRYIPDDPVHKTEFYLGDDISTLAGSPSERFLEASLGGVNPFICGDITEGRSQACLGRENHFERYGIYDGLP